MFPNAPATPTPEFPLPEGDSSGSGFLKWLLELMGYGIEKGTDIAQSDIGRKSQFAGNETTPMPTPPLSPEASSRTQRVLEANTRFNRAEPPFPPFPAFEPGTVEKYGPSGYGGGTNNPPLSQGMRRLEPTSFGSGPPPELSRFRNALKEKKATFRPSSGVRYPTNPGPATARELFEHRRGK